jgi:hypothetical protein
MARTRAWQQVSPKISTLCISVPRQATVKDRKGKTFKVIKGASRDILAMSANICTMTPLIAKHANEFREQWYR